MMMFQQNNKGIILTAAPDGRIRATLQRERGKPETITFNTILDFWEWPGISPRTAISFSARGLVPKLNVPYELIFWFSAPDEIKTFVALTNSGNQGAWLNLFSELLKALDTERFSIRSFVGTSIDLSHLISNPKGYSPAELLRCYRDDWFW